MRRPLLSAIVASLALLSATAAHADAIDGKWCNGSQSIEINGPTITLPSGNRHQGDYTRHTFDFIIPETEASSGDQLAMVVQSEELMHLQRTVKGTGKPGPVESWQRCANIS